MCFWAVAASGSLACLAMSDAYTIRQESKAFEWTLYTLLINASMERTGEGEGDVGVRELLDVPADDIAEHLLGQAEVVVLRAQQVRLCKISMFIRCQSRMSNKRRR